MKRALAVCVILAAGCGGGEDPSPEGYAGPPIPWAYAPFPSARAPADNPSSAAKEQLGTLLFYDPILSSDRKVACATCHSEIWGLGDGLPVSIGVGGVGPTGPGRTGPNQTRRNAPTLWNVGHKDAFFWDGRAATLEEQALAPLADAKELGRPPEELAADLRTIPAYANAFAEAFAGDPEAVSPKNLARALATFERSFVSDRAPYDRYVSGDTGALDADTVTGMFLFGEAGCAGCHVPPLFESARYEVRGISGAELDEGRFETTADELDRDAFRVPTLRNARESDPYFHDGFIAKLVDAVAYEVARQVDTGESRSLDVSEIELVARFIDKALTDQTRNPPRPKSVPSGLRIPLDGFRIPR